MLFFYIVMLRRLRKTQRLQRKCQFKMLILGNISTSYSAVSSKKQNGYVSFVNSTYYTRVTMSLWLLGTIYSSLYLMLYSLFPLLECKFVLEHWHIWEIHTHKHTHTPVYQKNRWERSRRGRKRYEEGGRKGTLQNTNKRQTTLILLRNLEATWKKIIEKNKIDNLDRCCGKWGLRLKI